MAAGSFTVEYNRGVWGAPDNPIVRLDIDWTSDAAGAVNNSAKTFGLNGIVEALITDPDGTAAPTDNYDVVIKNEYGIDILQGIGADRDTSNSEYANIVIGTYFKPVVCGPCTLEITNAGNAKSGHICLLLRRV